MAEVEITDYSISLCSMYVACCLHWAVVQILEYFAICTCILRLSIASVWIVHTSIFVSKSGIS